MQAFVVLVFAANVFGIKVSFERVHASPVPRKYFLVDEFVCGNVPVYVPPSEWAEVEAIEFLRQGVVGVDKIMASQTNDLMVM